MFIWVATMIRYLKETYTYEDFNQVLLSTPKDIHALYRAGLDRIEKSHSKTLCIWIREIFAWVTRPPKDISIEELRIGISESRKVRYELVIRQFIRAGILFPSTMFCRPSRFSPVLYFSVRPRYSHLVSCNRKLTLLDSMNIPLLQQRTSTSTKYSPPAVPSSALTPTPLIPAQR
jgi:hypothetical protein